MNFSEHTKLRKEKFGTVIFDTLTEKIFITDEVGTGILNLIEQGHDLPGIVSALCDNFETDRQTIEKDVVEFADRLKTNKIISE